MVTALGSTIAVLTLRSWQASCSSALQSVKSARSAAAKLIRGEMLKASSDLAACQSVRPLLLLWPTVQPDATGRAMNWQLRTLLYLWLGAPGSLKLTEMIGTWVS